jgi:hypothetical protein
MKPANADSRGATSDRPGRFIPWAGRGNSPAELLLVLVITGVVSLVGVARIGNELDASTTSLTAPLDQGIFTLSCDSSSNGGTLPRECTCDGAGYSPALSWWNAPEGTQEFALLMTTPAGPGDPGTTKWN